MKKLEPTKLKLNRTNNANRKYLYYILHSINELGGNAYKNDILDLVGMTMEHDDFDDYVQSNGIVTWRFSSLWQASGLKKAGFINRNGKGFWSLTEEGTEALSKSADELYLICKEAWEKDKQFSKKMIKSNNTPSSQANTEINIDILSSQAFTDISNHIKSKDPYEFQYLVEYLLTAMGYHISFNAPKGKDGGIDLVAYQDPLGLKTPRIKIQVKHKPDTSIPVSDVRSLNGVLNPQSEVGLFVTSGKFSKDAEIFARENNNHIELIDLDRFVQLWTQYYSKLSDEQKNELPLTPIYFLGT